MDRQARRLESQLCKAVNDGEPKLVQLLLSQGAYPDVVGHKGVAPLHLAVGKETEKNMRCLKMLLQHGADPNVRSSEGLTALHIAAVWGCYQNLKMLLMNGGNPNIKDYEGNTPRQLAEQQENRKCAQLLQEYQATSEDTEDGDLPQFHYSVFSDHTDISSYPESENTFSSHSSMISDFGEAPLSSTRCSSFFNLSDIKGRRSSKGILLNRDFDMDAKKPFNHDWNNSYSQWASEGPSILSSTRMSAVGSAVAMPVLKENDLFTTDGVFTSKANGGTVSPSRRDTLPAFPSRRVSRKSVSFRDVDEYFPVFSPESSKQQPLADGSQCTGNLPFDLSEYSDFLDSERMATVLHKQGIDVTSPDHVYVFCRESSTSTEEDMEKTVINQCALEESDDEQQGEHVKEAQVKIPEQPAHLCKGSSSSETTSSHYSSCESDHYTSALEASLLPRHVSLAPAERVSVGAESLTNTQISPDTLSEFTGQNENVPSIQTERLVNSESETIQHLPAMLDKLALSEGRHQNNIVSEVCNCPVEDTKSEDCGEKPVMDTGCDRGIEALKDNTDFPLTPSPFVTGRTRSRLSRCSLRTSRTPESLLTSSLFEETLPTPVRTHRQTPRSQSSKDYYNSPYALCYTPPYLQNSSRRDFLTGDYADTQSSTIKAGSSVSDSQADTLILSKSVNDTATESQSLSDTVILEKNHDTSLDAYERNLAEVILAMQVQAGDCAEARDFLTDDLSSTDETKPNVNSNTNASSKDGLKNEDVWITDDCISQPDSSSSSSSNFSPRRSREDSDPLCTPALDALRDTA
ncbi:hypothetical protein Q5P01_015883 [Channa striata]|uniref:Uncharacterized protein n=1 Tax=Channa striata TaxID=64152 RepID=A0AA88ME32_CHASR|nr:hypothetical protein Q5P01_015883 [Channa striata]